MSQTLKKMASMAVALAAAMSLPVSGAQAAGESAKAVAAEDNEGMVVVRDADTGKLRAPTAAEHEHLMRSRSAASRNATPATRLPRSHHSGARGVRMTDESMHHSVMVRNADGSVSTMCVDANGAVHALHDEQAPTRATAAIPRATAKLQTE